MNVTSLEKAVSPATGVCTDPSCLAEIDAGLAAVLEKAVRLPETPGFPSAQRGSWQRQWQQIEGNLHRVRDHLAEMNGHVERGDKESLRHAMEVWNAIQVEDSQLNSALDAVRSGAGALSAHAREEWKSVDSAVTSYMESIHACALAMRVKLELRKDYSKEDANRVLDGMLGGLPGRAQATAKDAEAYAREYRQTVRELDAERHEFKGFMDFIKGLAMWVETPEERMKKHAETK